MYKAEPRNGSTHRKLGPGAKCIAIYRKQTNTQIGERLGGEEEGRVLRRNHFILENEVASTFLIVRCRGQRRLWKWEGTVHQAAEEEQGWICMYRDRLSKKPDRAWRCHMSCCRS